MTKLLRQTQSLTWTAGNCPLREIEGQGYYMVYLTECHITLIRAQMRISRVKFAPVVSDQYCLHSHPGVRISSPVWSVWSLHVLLALSGSHVLQVCVCCGVPVGCQEVGVLNNVLCTLQQGRQWHEVIGHSSQPHSVQMA